MKHELGVRVACGGCGRGGFHLRQPVLIHEAGHCLTHPTGSGFACVHDAPYPVASFSIPSVNPAAVIGQVPVQVMHGGNILNLMTLMEEQIFRETGIRNEAEVRRKARALHLRDERSKAKGYGGLAGFQKVFRRLTQRTVKFIRWLKNHFDTRLSWTQALAPLARIYATL